MLDAGKRGAVLVVLGLSLGLTACTATSPGPILAARPSSPPPPVSSAAPVSTSSVPPAPTAPAAPAAPTGKVVVLDPGHNGGNASHPAQINALVPAGRGQTKACNTTGTSTNAGYPEHAFNWDVANRVKADLAAKGYQVIMTRSDDTGVGPCVNVRAQIGNQANAAAVVAIHADGSEKAGARGFDVEYSYPALNAEQGTPSISLATSLRDAMVSAGFPLSNYLGTHGIFPRGDLGGLNLSDRPTALIECGNMRDAADAAQLTDPTDRQHYADAIAAGIEQYLGS